MPDSRPELYRQTCIQTCDLALEPETPRRLPALRDP